MNSKQMINMVLRVYLLVSVLILIVFTDLSGQQQNQYSLYNLNPFQFNPAFAGSESSLVLTGIYRSQWVNYPGNPESQLISAHMPLFITNGGIGLQAENSNLGAEHRTSMSFSYAQFLPLGGELKIAVAASLGYYNLTLDGSILRAPDGDYENGVDHLDNSLPNNSVGGGNLAPSAGLLLAYKGLRVGYSMKPVMDNSVDLLNIGQFSVDFDLGRHHYIYSSYFLALSETVSLNPSILYRTDAVINQVDIGLSAEIMNNYHVGASLRGLGTTQSESVGIQGGVNISSHLFLAYGYDVVISDLNVVGTGSHEVLLKYNFRKQIGAGTPARVIFNPRF